MPQSDSEGFESADEGTHESSIDNKGRKKRYSSSNYSDSAQDPDQISKEQAGSSKNLPQQSVKKQPNKDADGWDDFDIDENETFTQESCAQKIEPKEKKETPKKEQDTGWDDFDDWGQEAPEVNKTQSAKVQSPDIKSVADRLASVGTAEQKSGGWGWSGWGVDSLLNTATAGISTITSHVSQGINTVLETGIGAPDPEELARIKKAQAQAASQEASKKEMKAEGQTETTVQSSGDDGAFQLGSLLSGVTKFVESTGTKVIAGGLDTLETIGKKTMEVLQDGDPGLAKKKALFGLDSGDKPVLSQVLKEAKAKADEEDKIREEKREAKEVHYETLFDDFEGLVHLEALEMLSREVSMRIEERLRGIDDEKRQEVKETLQQVAELCELSEEDDEDSEAATSGDELHQRLLDSVRDLGVKLHFTEIVKVYGDILESLASEDSVTEKALYKQAVSALAAYSAKGVRLQLGAAQNLLLASRRSTADESDALTQMTMVLTKHVSELATRFTTKLNSIDTSNKEQINNYITNVFLEAENSTTYIQNAFQLTLPILQIGAV